MAKRYNNNWFEELQDYFLWIALGCLATNFILDWDLVKTIFGVYIFMAKLINASCIWIFGVLAGKRTFQLVNRFVKVFKSVEKGEGVEDD